MEILWKGTETTGAAAPAPAPPPPPPPTTTTTKDRLTHNFFNGVFSHDQCKEKVDPKNSKSRGKYSL